MPSSLNYVRPRRLPKSTYPPSANAQRVVSAVAALRDSWHRLHDLDRGVAVRNIIDLGVSRRRLAKELGFSEGLLRRLLKCLDAGAADLELAKHNLISTNELTRRARNGHRDEIIVDFEAAKRAILPRIAPASARLVRWLRCDTARDASALLVIEEARHELCAAAEAGKLSLLPVPVGMPTDEVIRRCRPERQQDESEATWYGRWACSWVFRVTQNADACWNALDEAFESILSEERARTFGGPTRLC